MSVQQIVFRLYENIFFKLQFYFLCLENTCGFLKCHKTKKGLGKLKTPSLIGNHVYEMF